MKIFEDVCKQLVSILKTRTYELDKLRKKFCRAIEKYQIEFMKWELPLDIANWGSEIAK